MADHSVDMETAYPRFWDSMGIWFVLDSWLSMGVGVGQLIGFDWAESSFQHFWLSPEERELSERKQGWGIGIVGGGVKGTWEKP